MEILKGVLLESKKHYLALKKKIERDIRNSPAGSIKKRQISGLVYYYLQKRVGPKIVQQYLGKVKPEELLKQIAERRSLKAELKNVDARLRLVRRFESIQ